MKKKRILFVIESLNCGGAEKSLTTLLNLIVKFQYEIDLQLFKYDGEFQALLPKQVNLLPELDYFKFCSEKYAKAIKKNIGKKNLKFLKSRVIYSIKIRKKKYTNVEQAVIFWKSVKNCFEMDAKNYDVAIAYAQGVPTFYVADYVKAKKKYAWINGIYCPEKKDYLYINKYYKEYKNIICVSDVACQRFTMTFQDCKNRMKVIYDIIDQEMIQKMSQLPSTSKEDMFTKKKVKILTVGRLVEQKGYDVAVEACRLLKQEGVSFCWFVVGSGPMETKIRLWIQKYDIEDCFKLLGVKANPYPYFKECDLYVQTSKSEGFGITLTEARILNKPVVTTEFDAVYMQIIPEKNALVAKINGKSVAEKILELIQNDSLRNNIIQNIKKEKKGNMEELEKFEQLLGE